MKAFRIALFWALSCTWGILMTLYGAVIALGLLLVGYRPSLFHGFVCFETGKDWGGLEAGGFIIVNQGASEELKRHEAGHGIQNLIFGPLTPFLVSIPSAVRYWARRIGKKTYPPYDAIWFEGMATRLGEKFFGLGAK